MGKSLTCLRFCTICSWLYSKPRIKQSLPHFLSHWARSLSIFIPSPAVMLEHENIKLIFWLVSLFYFSSLCLCPSCHSKLNALLLLLLFFFPLPSFWTTWSCVCQHMSSSVNKCFQYFENNILALSPVHQNVMKVMHLSQPPALFLAAERLSQPNNYLPNSFKDRGVKDLGWERYVSVLLFLFWTCYTN